MGKNNKANESQELSQTIIHAIHEKKGEDVALLNLKSISSAVCDYFVICSANSDVQVKAIAAQIEKEVKDIHGENVFHKEGFVNAEWILLDYFDVIVHVFQRTSRKFYNLEALWADAKLENVEIAY